MDVLRQDVLKTIAEEVGVRDVKAVRPHIVALAEKAQGELADYALTAFIQRTCDGRERMAQSMAVQGCKNAPPDLDCRKAAAAAVESQWMPCSFLRIAGTIALYKQF